MDRTAVTVGPGMDVPIMHDSDRYELVRDIGAGNFGVARLMRDRQTNELVAVKYIERGEKVSRMNLFPPFYFKNKSALHFVGFVKIQYLCVFFRNYYLSIAD